MLGSDGLTLRLSQLVFKGPILVNVVWSAGKGNIHLNDGLIKHTCSISYIILHLPL